MRKPYIVGCSECGTKTPRENRLSYICTKCKKYTRRFHEISKEKRATGSCEVCGDRSGLVLHHIDTDKKNDSEDNLMILCNQCHSSIHAHGLMFPKKVRWGQCGKRLIYNDRKNVKKNITTDDRWGKRFTTNNNYL